MLPARAAIQWGCPTETRRDATFQSVVPAPERGAATAATAPATKLAPTNHWMTSSARASTDRRNREAKGFRGQGIWSGSPVRIVSGQRGTASPHPGRRQSSASRPSRGARVPRPYRDPPSGARWAGSRAWFALEPVGRHQSAAPTSQNSRLRLTPDNHTPCGCPAAAGEPGPRERLRLAAGFG